MGAERIRNRHKLKRRAAKFFRQLAYKLDPAPQPYRPKADYDQLMVALENAVMKQRLYLDCSLSMEMLSSIAGTNRTYLTRAFKRRGLTFSDFINSYRIRYAAEMMAANAEMHASEVAERSGFANERNMNYCIIRRYGISFFTLRQRISQLLSELQEGQIRQPCHTDE